ncbi:hypothetical protein KC19_VG257700 [Ceratodon purpureus]|uniref:Uncharacterized protein n=1 Tax=Ceratodon purpureus TaxID=3225 RepID=A0A8T0HU97_CERPU|nr:hypothetical protein KC19_VG257700 [Ceratodon purpureus]
MCKECEERRAEALGHEGLIPPTLVENSDAGDDPEAHDTCGEGFYRISVQVKIEKMQEEKRSTALLNEGGMDQWRELQQDKVGPAPHEEQVADQRNALTSTIHPGPSVRTKAPRTTCEVPAAHVGTAEFQEPVKISKRTRKPVRKYEKKKKFALVETGSAGGTESFVGQVTAMIDKITEAAVEENCRVRGAAIIR